MATFTHSRVRRVCSRLSLPRPGRATVDVPQVPDGPAPRRDLVFDGLRGLGILLVLGYHAFPAAIPGGNIGVDILFVLSGYFVTRSLISRGLQTVGQDVKRFWVRRARRLVPALVVMLVTVSALSMPLVPHVPARQREQWLAALTWTTNWSLIGDRASYFSQFEPRLFQHLWSLGVEAQFYALWPVIVLAMIVVVQRRSKAAPSARIIAVTAFTLAGCSFLAMLGLGALGASASRLYMGTDTHAFGLLAGAGIALTLSSARSREDEHPRVLRVRRGASDAAGSVDEALHRRHAGAAVLVTLVGLLVTLAVLAKPDDGLTLVFVVPMATAVTVGVLVVAAGGAVRQIPGMTSKPMMWLGRRSYALYLWHWPFLVLARDVLPLDGGLPAAMRDVTVLAISLAVAEASWRYIESPILTHGFRASGRTARQAVAGLTGRPVALVLLTLVVAVVVTAAGAALALSPQATLLEQQLSQ